MSVNIRTLIAFDYGTKKMGVAVGQQITQSATPLKTLIHLNGKPDWLKIEGLIKEWGVNAFVVGLPLKPDGSEQPISKKARKFKNQLHERYKMPVFLVDERYTTVDAKQTLFDEGGYQGLQKSDVDSYAAKLVLEQWFFEYGSS